MLEQNVKEPNASPWNSPICLVSKKQIGELRFCIDLRALNSTTKLDTYPISAETCTKQSPVDV